MKIKLLLLIIFIGYNFSHAQAVSKKDSLKKYTYEELKEKFYDCNYGGKPESAKLIAQYYLIKAKKEKKQSQIAEGYAFMYVNENKKMR